MTRVVFTLVGLLLGVSGGLGADPLVDQISARNLGPINFGGRITSLAIVESNPATFYVGSATGGVWKTTNAGDTFSPLFDQQTTLNIGAITVSPSNPEIVWVGTGESNPRNSVSWGNGVYKSVDGGKTWQNMGLKDSRHIGRIVIHPTKPDLVYVAAMGHFWGTNIERGIYRTKDAGKTWEQVKFIDDSTGFIDLAMDQTEPDVLYAAAYPVRRDGFSGGNPRMGWGPTGGLYRSVDGGTTWHRMTKGLPDRPIGRCGISIYSKDPRVVYAVVQTDLTPTTTAGAPPKEDSDPSTGGIFRSDDRGTTWKKINNLCPRPFYYGQIRIDPNDEKRIYVLGVRFFASDDGGKNFPMPKGPSPIHPDHHDLWINPKDSNHLILGNDGGLYVSRTRGRTWEAIRQLPIAQFYGVAADLRVPYRVYGGLQDNGNWSGASQTNRAEGILAADWKRLSSADGFQAQTDPTDLNTVYVETQYGGFLRVDLKEGKSKAIRPPSPKDDPLRFNWNSPMLLSPHDAKTIYYAANKLFRSPDRGDTWTTISPDLTNPPEKNIHPQGHTITAVAESPRKAGVLYVGTDDGKLHFSPDGGKSWKDLSGSIPEIRKGTISRIECSPFEVGEVFVAIDRHRNDDRKPYLFHSTDHGETWKSIVNNLPEDGPVHVIRTSSKNRDLLFVGTEFGLLVSTNAGKVWQRMRNGLPPAVTVHDLVIHPRERELIIATHGRGIYIMDIAPLEELTPARRVASAHLCDVKSAIAWTIQEPEKVEGRKPYAAPNPPFGAVIRYHLKETVSENPKLRIETSQGKELVTLTGSKEAGLNQVVWDLRDRQSMVVGTGDYQVSLTVGTMKETKTLRVVPVQP